MPEIPDVDEIVDQLLPLDGPYDPEAVMAAARAVGELVRRLNHATFGPAALRYPSYLWRVVGGLRSGLYGLEQTFGQLAKRLDGWATDPRIGHAQGHDAAAACLDAADQLRQSAGALHAVTSPLDQVSAITSHLNADQPPHTSRRAFRVGAATSDPAPPPPTTPPAPGSSRPRRAR